MRVMRILTDAKKQTTLNNYTNARPDSHLACTFPR